MDVGLSRKRKSVNRMITVLMTFYVKEGHREGQVREKRLNLKEKILFRRGAFAGREICTVGYALKPTHKSSVIDVDRKVGWTEGMESKESVHI